MRTARIVADGPGFYHVWSRVIDRGMIFSDQEKETLRLLLRSVEGFSGVEILTYSIMTNHFHILLYVPEPVELTDEELLKRLSFLYGETRVRNEAMALADYRERKDDEAAERLKAKYTYRMYNLSEFMKTFKGRCSMRQNARLQRKGPLWESRFSSLLVEGSEFHLSTLAAYIDLNPVRAGIVSDPKDYRYGGYGEAIAGGKLAREGIKKILLSLGQRGSWGQAGAIYRKLLYEMGREKGLKVDGTPIRVGFSMEEVQRVLDRNGKLTLNELLRCKVRYFRQGLAFGSQEFVESVFRKHRDKFGKRRQTGARPIAGCASSGLYTLRDLRKAPITISDSSP